MNIFFEIHQNLPREAPGDNASTRKAFSLLTNVPPQPKILDIGCGPGMQTIELAKLTDGQITAVDTHQPFLDELQRRALAEGVSDNINPVNQSMLSLDFVPHIFDILWSEGAIYIMGFETGLKSWRTLLKTGGYLVVSELCWLQQNPPIKAL
ncbi:MAG: class I SAM-dependent methyltransferase [Coleofasciculus sp.]|uniref:class I SAM-dependent methyltransferase n=1 Tax=Coleofasciculus sp. TaxID=3100458 RepID=UPI003A3AFFC0